MPDIHKPVVETDGGPWATHDHACSICWVNKSILDMGTGVFEPCGECRARGWRTRRLSWLERFVTNA